MLHNHIYNILMQLTEENKSLWRIKNEYKNDADACDDCLKLWSELEKTKEEFVAKMSEIAKNHLS